jgi:formamidopyrimidine-DNA glycosylase
MPELPEVETVRRGLEPIIGHQVVGCRVRRRDVIRDLGSSSTNNRRGKLNDQSLLIGCTITELRRHGKQLAIIACPDQTDQADRSQTTIDKEDLRIAIVIHLGMSGQLLRSNSNAKTTPAKHVHVVWTLDDEQRISFQDPRRFGKVVLHPSLTSLENDWSKLGDDGVTISARALETACRRTSRTIKAALLDQKLIAGVGNIYADESLFDAGINPNAISKELTNDQFKALAYSIRKILKAAIKARGSTLRDYRDANNQSGSAQLLHKVYGRAGEPCLVCSSTICSAQLVQRTTCWCPQCQPDRTR